MARKRANHDEHHLKWFHDTVAGQAFLARLLENACANCERGQAADAKCLTCGDRRHVLVVCGVTPEGKAWLDVYADERVRVVVKQLLTTGAGAELAAEAAIERGLPIPFREIFLPHNLRARHTILMRTVEDEAGIQAALIWLRAARTLSLK